MRSAAAVINYWYWSNYIRYSVTKAHTTAASPFEYKMDIIKKTKKRSSTLHKYHKIMYYGEKDGSNTQQDSYMVFTKSSHCYKNAFPTAAGVLLLLVKHNKGRWMRKEAKTKRGDLKSAAG